MVGENINGICPYCDTKYKIHVKCSSHYWYTICPHCDKEFIAIMRAKKIPAIQCKKKESKNWDTWCDAMKEYCTKD